MKSNIIKFFFPVVMLLAFVACDEWTETESLDIHRPTLEEQNPELYAQYMQALRDYKARDHKIVFVSVDNPSTAPSQRSEHIKTLPDSVDYIVLKNPADVHPTLVAEMSLVREKGTRVLYTIDYDALEARWAQILEEEENNQPEESETPETPDESDGDEGEEPQPDPAVVQEQRFLDFCREQTALQLSYCDRYGFDGVIVACTGKNYSGMADDVQARYIARQEAFFGTVGAWYGTHAGKSLSFCGKPQYLADKSILAQCDYIILPAVDATSGDELSLTVELAAVTGVPTDRFIVTVSTVSPSDPSDSGGYFSALDTDGKSQLRAIKGAAQWTLIPAGHAKPGIYVVDAQNDYFNISLVYKNIREAISIMNPSPKN